MKIAPATYAQVLWEAKLVKDKISLNEPTAEDMAWLQEQIAKAKKAPEVKPPPKENKPLPKQDALAAIEKLPVPRSVDECKQLIGRAGAILSQARVRVPNANSGVNIQLACTNRRFAEAHKALQAVAREAITGKKNEDNRPQPQKLLSKQEALADIEKLQVPHSVGECMQLINQVGSVLVRTRTQPPNGNWVGKIQQTCFSNRFDEARNTAQALAREAITENKKSEDINRQPSIKETNKLTKQAALALIDRFPVSADPQRCMFTAFRAMRMLVELHVMDPQSENAMQAIRKDCAEGRFADALKKTKDNMHRVLK